MMATAYTHSLVVIAPTELWASIQALNAALGHDVGDGRPLSATGAEPETHRGVQAWVQQTFAHQATGAEELPADAPEGTAALLSACTISADELIDPIGSGPSTGELSTYGSAAGHWAAALAAAQLQVIE